MYPSWAEAHATPGHGKRRPRSFQPPLYLPAHADTHKEGWPANRVVLGVHARTRNKRRKKGKVAESARRDGENKESLGRSAKTQREPVPKWDL